MSKLSIPVASRKHNFFSDSCDTTTTLGFGQFQPVFCSEIVPQSSVNLDVSSFVRLSPLSVPTYGRCNLHHYTCFVPMDEIYHPWDSFLTGKSYNGGLNSYVPTFVPSLRGRDLLAVLAMHSSVTVFRLNTTTETSPSRVKPSNVDANVVSAMFSSFTYDFKGAPGNPPLYEYLRNLLPSDVNIFDDPYRKSEISFNEASNGADIATTFYLNEVRYYFFFRLSDFGKYLRSILIGLGYQVNTSSTQYSLLPLFAYYKCWFDLFAPLRYVSYKDSSLYRLIEWIESTNQNLPLLFTSSAPQNVDSRLFFVEFLRDLKDCYYTYSTDYVSAHHSGVSTNNSFLSFSTQTSDEVSSSGVSVNPAGTPSISSSSGSLSSISRSSLRVLNFLSKYINSNTYLGGRIKSLMRALYNSDSEDCTSTLINSFITPIEISDVMNTAETSEGYLGEYAGKGIGFSQGHKNKFKATKFGYLIHFISVVPDSGFSQAVDPCLGHVNRFDFYTPDYDGLTLVPTKKEFIYGTTDGVEDDGGLTSTFGNIPIYSEYKHHYNILNGDISLHSTRDSLLPYTLDRLLPYTKFYTMSSSGALIGGVHPLEDIVNGTIWRYCGRYRWLGNYNRIFVNSGVVNDSESVISLSYYGFSRLDDNFILHNHFKFDRHAPMLSLGQSFDTGSDVDPDNTVVAPIE